MLQGDESFKLSVGQWRVIFKYSKENTIDILFVLAIGNRGDIYK